MSAAAGGIFKALVEASLKEFAAGAFQDEEEGEAAATALGDEASAREQALVRAAALGRAAAGPSMALLANVIQERLHRLQSCGASGPFQFIASLEIHCSVQCLQIAFFAEPVICSLCHVLNVIPMRNESFS